jgi:outer membrane protein assembly factor BamB
MRFWPVRFRFVVLFAFLGVGLWLSRGYWTEPQDQLVAIDAKTGEILWNRQWSTPKQILWNRRWVPLKDYPPVVLSGDRLLVTEYEEKGGCFWNELNQQSGELIWRKSLKELGLDGCPIPDILGVAQDGQFYTFWEGRLWEDAKFEETTLPQQAIVAMDFNNHKVRWVSPLQSQYLPIFSQLRLSDSRGEGALVIRSSQIFAAMNLVGKTTIEAETEFRALQPESGIKLWQKRLKGRIGGGSGDSNMNFIDYKSSAIFRWEGRKGDDSWNIYDMETGELEVKNIEGGRIKRHSDDYIYNIFKGDYNISNGEAFRYLPFPRRHTLNDLIPKVSVKHPLCNSYSSSSISIYPSKSHFLGFCEVEQVIYNDPKANQLFAVDDQTGKQKWQLYVPSYNNYHDRKMVVVSDDGEHLFLPMAFRDSKSLTPHLQSITTEDGKQVWRLPIVPLMKPVISGDRLFVTTRLPRWRTSVITRPRPFKP